MKKIIIAALATLGMAAAQAETVNFSGTVATSCTFSNKTSGSLVASSNGSSYVMDAGFAGHGSGASVDIAYSGSPTFSIQAVQGFSSAPGGAPSLTSVSTGVSFGVAANQTAAINAGATGFSSGTKYVTLDNGSTSDTATVKMAAYAATAFPVGNYDAQSTITCQ